jgi:hypothetical protein
MPIFRSSGACEVWMIECYKYSAPLALRCEDIDSNDLLFAHSSIIIPGIVAIFFLAIGIRLLIVNM